MRATIAIAFAVFLSLAALACDYDTPTSDASPRPTEPKVSQAVKKYDGEIKNIASHTIGHEPTDSEIHGACSALKSHGWDYYSAGMETVLDGSKTSIMAAITTIAGKDTQSYCEGK